KTPHGSDRLWFVRPKLIGGHRFLPGVVPLLLVHERKRFARVPPRLPRFHRMRHRSPAEDGAENERDENDRCDKETPAPARARPATDRMQRNAWAALSDRSRGWCFRWD